MQNKNVRLPVQKLRISRMASVKEVNKVQGPSKCPVQLHREHTHQGVSAKSFQTLEYQAERRVGVESWH